MLSLTHLLERIMTDALEDHDGKVSIGGRNITNHISSLGYKLKEQCNCIK